MLLGHHVLTHNRFKNFWWVFIELEQIPGCTCKSLLIFAFPLFSQSSSEAPQEASPSQGTSVAPLLSFTYTHRNFCQSMGRPWVAFSMVTPSTIKIHGQPGCQRVPAVPGPLAREYLAKWCLWTSVPTAFPRKTWQKTPSWLEDPCVCPPPLVVRGSPPPLLPYAATVLLGASCPGRSPTALRDQQSHGSGTPVVPPSEASGGVAPKFGLPAKCQCFKPHPSCPLGRGSWRQSPCPAPVPPLSHVIMLSQWLPYHDLLLRTIQLFGRNSQGVGLFSLQNPFWKGVCPKNTCHQLLSIRRRRVMSPEWPGETGVHSLVT